MTVIEMRGAKQKRIEKNCAVSFGRLSACPAASATKFFNLINFLNLCAPNKDNFQKIFNVLQCGTHASWWFEFVRYFGSISR